MFYFRIAGGDPMNVAPPTKTVHQYVLLQQICEQLNISEVVNPTSAQCSSDKPLADPSFSEPVLILPPRECRNEGSLCFAKHRAGDASVVHRWKWSVTYPSCTVPFPGASHRFPLDSKLRPRASRECRTVIQPMASDVID